MGVRGHNRTGGTAHTGPVGEVRVSGKLLNGFTVAFDGSGSSVTLKLRIKGGTM